MFTSNPTCISELEDSKKCEVVQIRIKLGVITNQDANVLFDWLLKLKQNKRKD